MVVHASSNPSNMDAQVGGLQAQGQALQLSEVLSKLVRPCLSQNLKKKKSAGSMA